MTQQNPFQFPLIEKAVEVCLKSFDDMINGFIEKAGKFLDTCTAEVKGIGPKALSLGSGKLGGGLDCAPALGPSPSPSPTHGQAIAKSPGLDISPKLAQEVSRVDMSFAQDTAIRKANISAAQGMNFGGQDLCSFAPMQTPGVGVAMGQGMSGRAA